MKSPSEVLGTHSSASLEFREGRKLCRSFTHEVVVSLNVTVLSNLSNSMRGKADITVPLVLQLNF